MNETRRRRWLRVVAVLEVLILLAVLGWLASGQPGLGRAADLAERGLGLRAGDVFAADQGIAPGHAADGAVGRAEGPRL